MHGEAESNRETATDAAIESLASFDDENAEMAVPPPAQAGSQQRVELDHERHVESLAAKRDMKKPATMQRAPKAATAVSQYPLASPDDADRVTSSFLEELDAGLLESLARDQIRKGGA